MVETVSIIGDVGFVGLHAARELLDRGLAVSLVGDVDVHPDDEYLQAVVSECGRVSGLPEDLSGALRDADVVVLLGTKVGGVGRFHEIPADLVADNARLYERTFRAVRDAGVDRIVFRSSPMVYEQATEFPLQEDDVGAIPPPESGYGFQKLLGERLCGAYRDQYGIPYVVVRPFNVVGAGDYPGEEVGQAHVVPDLTKKILEQRQHPLSLLGDGYQVRGFFDVRDLARAFHRCVVSGSAENEAFNVGPSDGTSIREVARLLWERCGRSEGIAFDAEPGYEHDVERRLPDVSKAARKLSWRAEIDLEESIDSYVSWYEEVVADR